MAWIGRDEGPREVALETPWRPQAAEAARRAWRAEVLAALEPGDVWPRPQPPPARRSLRWLWSALAAAAAVGAMAAAVLLGDEAGGWLAARGHDWRARLDWGAVAALLEPAASGASGAAGAAGAARGTTEPAAPPEAREAAAAFHTAGPVAVAAPADWWVDHALEARLAQAVPSRIGRVAVAVRHLTTGATAGLAAEVAMPPASVFKLGVLLEAFRQVEAGRLALEEPLLLTPDDWDAGAGVLQARIGQRVAVGEALRLLIGVSDNTAALALLRRLDADAVNAGYQRHGLAQTRIYVDDRPDTTTAADTATLLALLATGRLAPPPATQQMLDLLAQDQPQAWIQEGLPAGTVVAHKYGQLPGVRNDAAIVYSPHGPYVLVVLADRLDDEAAGEQAISRLAREVDAYFAGR